VATVAVRGEATVPAEPDEATIVLDIEAVRRTAEEALSDLTERSAALGWLLDELGVERARRTTAGVSIGEHGEHDREGRWQHRGYRASNQLSVRVAETAVVGRLLGEAVARAQARVSGPVWTVAADNPVRLEACRRAAEDARLRAEAYAEALGARLGAIVAVRDPRTRPGPEPRPLTMRAAAAPAADVPVESGEQLITVAVEVEFVLEQG
jgi:uncharacterized protein YggE